MGNRISIIRSSMPPLEEYVDEIRSIWENTWLTNNGPKHVELKEKLRQYLGVDFLNLFGNGHMALQIAIEVMDLQGEVITSPFSFGSTTHTILSNGLKPVFCDISPEDFNIDPNKIEALITEKTSAIVPVHIFGNSCDVAAIGKIAEKYGLKVIYDAAQAFGVKVNGKSIGSYGTAAAFSFHATKTFHTIEGGAVTFSNPGLQERLTKMANYGIGLTADGKALDRGPDIKGFNAKMNEFEAAMGLCNLRYLDGEVAKRKNAHDRYTSRLKKVQGIHMVPDREGITRNYSYFPIIVKEEYGLTRDELLEKLNADDIYPRKYFSPLTIDYPCYQTDYGNSHVPTARYIVERVMSLPMHSYLTEGDVDRICDIIEKK